MLEALFLVWLVIGLVGLIIYSFTESETPGLIESVFFVLIGPIIFIWFFFSWLSDREKKSGRKSPPRNKSNEPAESLPRASYDQIEKFKNSIRKIQAFIEARENASEYPSKQEIVEIQRFGELASKPEMERIGNTNAVIEVLAWGLWYVDGAYGAKDRAMGGRRKTAILTSLERICARTGQELPSVEPRKLAVVKSKKKESKKPDTAKARVSKKKSAKSVAKQVRKKTKQNKSSTAQNSAKAKPDSKAAHVAVESAHLPVIDISESVNYLENPLTWVYFFTRKTQFLLESAPMGVYVKRSHGYVRKPGVDLNSQWLKRDFHPHAIPVFRKFLALADSPEVITALNECVYTPGYVSALRESIDDLEQEKLPRRVSGSLEFLGLTRKTTFNLLYKAYGDVFETKGTIDHAFKMNQSFCFVHEFLCFDSGFSLSAPTFSAEEFVYGITLALTDIHIDDWNVDQAYESIMTLRERDFWGIQIPFDGNAHQEYRPFRERLEKLVKQLVKAGQFEKAQTIFAFALDLERERANRGGEVFTDPDNPLSHWKSDLEQIIEGSKSPRLIINHPRQAENALKLGLITEKKFSDRIDKLSGNEVLAQKLAQKSLSDRDIERLQALDFSNISFEKKLIRSAKFNFPFDVETFATHFPDSWELQDDLVDEFTFMVGPDDAKIGAAAHSLSVDDPLASIVKRTVEHTEGASPVQSRGTSIGTRLWYFDVAAGDDTPTMFMVEVQGPELQSVRFIYMAEELDERAKELLLSAAADLGWSRKAPDKSAWPEVGSGRDLKKLINNGLGWIPEVRDELLDTFDAFIEEDDVVFGPYDIDQLFGLGGECFPTINAMVRYSAREGENSTEDLCRYAAYFAPHLLDDAAMAARLVAQAEAKAGTTGDHIALADYYRDYADDAEKARHFLLHAQENIDDCSDARSVLEHELTTKDACDEILELLAANLDNEKFVASVFGPIDVLRTAKDRDFINQDDFERRVREIAAADFGSLPWLGMAQSLKWYENRELLDLMLDRAMARTNSPADKHEIYRFLNDDLEDEVAARAYLEANEADLNALLDADREADERKEQVDQIMRCAMLAAAGKGQLAKEELSDIEMGLRGHINRWIDMREAVEYYEKTDDLDGALEIFPPDTPTCHTVEDMALFGGLPPWLGGLWEEVNEVESSEDLVVLGKREAAKIEDPYLQKVACFACRYLCEADGEFSEDEKMMLLLMSNEWSTDLMGVNIWARQYLMPVANGEELAEMDSDSPTSFADALTMAANSVIDQMVEEGVDREEALKAIMEAFNDGGEESEPGSGNDFSEIEDESVRHAFKAIEDNDESALVEALDAGVDPNVVGTVSSITGFTPLFFAAYLGRGKIAKLLVERGSDIEWKNQNFNPPATPLVVALSGRHEEGCAVLLIELGADVEPYRPREYDESPLGLAAQFHLLVATERLIEKGADPNWKSSTGMTPVKKVCMPPETDTGVDLLKSLLENGGNPNEPDDEGWYPIHNAMYQGNIRMAQELLDHGVPADLEFPESSDESGSLLHTACKIGKNDLIELILNHLSDEQLANDREPVFLSLNENGIPDMGDGELIATAISAAMERGTDKEDIEEIVSLLLDAGIKPDLFGVCFSFFIPGLAERVMPGCKDGLGEVLSDKPILVYVTTVGLANITDGWSPYNGDENEVWRGAIESMKKAGLSVPSALEEIGGDGTEEDDDDLTLTIEMDSADDEDKYPVEASRNSFLQACVCIFLAAYGDGDVNEEEIEGLFQATNSLSRIYEFSDDQDPSEYIVQAQNIVNEQFEGYSVVPLNLLLRYAAQIAKNITGPYLQKAVGWHALYAADADDELDEEERRVILVYLDQWGLESGDLQDVEDDFQ